MFLVVERDRVGEPRLRTRRLLLAHHHIVRFTGPVGNAFGVVPPASADPRDVAAPTASAALRPLRAALHSPVAVQSSMLLSSALQVIRPSHNSSPWPERISQPSAVTSTPARHGRPRRPRSARARTRRPSPAPEPSSIRHDSRLLVPVAAETVAGMVRVVEPVRASASRSPAKAPGRTASSTRASRSDARR